MNDPDQLPSDHELMEQARGGSDAAWAELRARHLAAVRALARSRPHRQRGKAADAAFDRLCPDEARSAGDDIGLPPVRPRAIGLLTGGSYGPADTGVGDPDEHRELLDVAAGFRALPTVWQTVLWHRWVEQTPAAGLTAILGRSPAEVMALERTAARGLVDAYTRVVASGTPPPEPECVPVLPLLGAYRRDALPDAQQRTVDHHVVGSRSGPETGCDTCRRHLDVFDRLDSVVPDAVVPGLAGVTVDRYRALVGAGAFALGTAALATRRGDRDRRLALVGAAAAVIIAVLAAAFFVREPFGTFDSDLADLLERASTTAVPGPSTTDPSTPQGSDVPVAPEEALPNRIELVFPEAPQGAVDVRGGRALDLGVSLSTPTPVFAGATGTIDTAITNNDTEDASVRFLVRTSPGVSFDRLSGGVGSCFAENDEGARCTVSLPAGTTGSLSLRFLFRADVADRLVVVPSVRSEALEVPVEFVPGLLIGQTGRGELRTAGATLGRCDESPSCPGGRRNASSAALDLPAGAAVERALLVWEGERADDAWADAVGLIPDGSSTAVAVTAGNVTPPSGALTTGSGIGVSESADAPGFRSIADVTDLVTAAGSGDYTVVRPPSLDDEGDGSWTLTVVTAPRPGDASARRLFVVICPDQVVTAGEAAVVAIPVGGSSVPRTPLRAVSVTLQAASTGTGSSSVSLNGAPLTDGDAFDGLGASGGEVTYDLDIASTEEILILTATTTTETLRLASIGLAADIVP